MQLFKSRQGEEKETTGAPEIERPVVPPPNVPSPPPALQPPLPQPPLPGGPYTSSEQHLCDELRRIDYLVHAQTVRWRLTIGSSKPPQLWGMVHVTDAEIENYLESDFVLPGRLPADLENSLQDYWERAALEAQWIRKRLVHTPAELTLRLNRLTSQCGLSDCERDVILICLLPEFEGRYRRLFGYLQDDVSRNLPTVELLLQILHPVLPDVMLARSLFTSKSKLLKHHLLSVGDDLRNDGPLSMSSVRVDAHIANYLLGSDDLDARLLEIVTPSGKVRWEELITDPERLERLKSFAGWWDSGRGHHVPGAILFLHGPYGVGRLSAARGVCTGTSLLVADVARAFQSRSPFEQLVDLTYREASLRGAAVFWSHC